MTRCGSGATWVSTARSLASSRSARRCGARLPSARIGASARARSATSRASPNGSCRGARLMPFSPRIRNAEMPGPEKAWPIARVSTDWSNCDARNSKDDWRQLSIRTTSSLLFDHRTGRERWRILRDFRRAGQSDRIRRTITELVRQATHSTTTSWARSQRRPWPCHDRESTESRVAAPGAARAEPGRSGWNGPRLAINVDSRRVLFVGTSRGVAGVQVEGVVDHEAVANQYARSCPDSDRGTTENSLRSTGPGDAEESVRADITLIVRGDLRVRNNNPSASGFADGAPPAE